MKHLGPYQIVGELGHSAASIVYHAFNPETGLSVALKTLRVTGEAASPLSPLARLRNEARIAGGLRHPNLRAIHDYGEEQGVAYLSMELVEGATLARLLANAEPLPLTRILAILEQLCQGLDCLHAHGVTHCDLKPANVLLTTESRAMITDFGVAMNAEDAARACRMATPLYLSPEQALGHPVDWRSDLYSLAVMLYRMLAGVTPFDGATPLALTKQAAFTSPQPISHRWSAAPPTLDAFFVRALAKEPSARWQSSMELAREFALALR